MGNGQKIPSIKLATIFEVSGGKFRQKFKYANFSY